LYKVITGRIKKGLHIIINDNGRILISAPVTVWLSQKVPLSGTKE